jgi:L-amino acid N-acyltransferase YncA
MAENQRLAAENLERAGAALFAHSPDEVPALLRSLDDDGLRASRIAAAAAITDGHGAQLVVDAMLGGCSQGERRPQLRPAHAGDGQLIWLWRNDHATRMVSQKTAPIPWADHMAWWDSALASDERRILIAEAAGVPVAMVRFDRSDEEGFEVSINLAPAARGSGLGGRILSEACKAFRSQHNEARLLAMIRRDNSASRRIFESLGFVRSGALLNSAFDRYVLAEGRAE